MYFFDQYFTVFYHQRNYDRESLTVTNINEEMQEYRQNLKNHSERSRERDHLLLLLTKGMMRLNNNQIKYEETSTIFGFTGAGLIDLTAQFMMMMMMKMMISRIIYTVQNH
jgi:hypothetical protein